MGRWFLVILGSVGIVMACDHKTAPPPLGSPPALAVTAITVNGRTRLGPGETEPFEAIAQFSDHTTQVYTTRVDWRSSNGSIAIAANGTATARVAGETTITAALGRLMGSLSVMVIPAGTYRLAGTVLESGLPVTGAGVKVTSGQGAGVTTNTDYLGQYRLYGVAGPVDIQVSKLGYTTLTKTVAIGADDLLDFPELVQTNAVSTLSGAYTLTIAMDPGCKPFGPPFPLEVNTRTYSAVIAQNGPRLTVQLSGGNFLQFNGQSNAFEGRVEPDRVTFKLGSLGGSSYGSYYYYYSYHIGVPNLAELLSNGQYLTYLGSASTTATSTGLDGPLIAQVMLFVPAADGTPLPRTSCWSSQHHFTLTRLTAGTRRR